MVVECNGVSPTTAEEWKVPGTNPYRQAGGKGPKAPFLFA